MHKKAGLIKGSSVNAHIKEWCNVGSKRRHEHTCHLYFTAAKQNGPIY